MIQPYIYDWSVTPPTSDDPRMPFGPPGGGPPVNRVWLNGVEVSRLGILSIRTGERGYVKYLLTDEKGVPKISPATVGEGGVVRSAGKMARVVRGKVEYAGNQALALAPGVLLGLGKFFETSRLVGNDADALATEAENKVAVR